MRNLITTIVGILLTFMASRAQMLSISDSSLICSSELIVRAKIGNNRIQWIEQPKFIFTLHNTKVTEILKGNPTTGMQILVAIPGGYDRERDLGLVISEQAELKQDEEAILFLCKASGYSDGIDYRGLEPFSNQLGTIYRVNGFFQGYRRVYLDRQLNVMMVHKPNESRSVEMEQHQLDLKNKIAKYNTSHTQRHKQKQ